MDTELSLICIVGKKVKEFFPLYLFADTWLDVFGEAIKIDLYRAKTQGVYTQLADWSKAAKSVEDDEKSAVREFAERCKSSDAADIVED